MEISVRLSVLLLVLGTTSVMPMAANVRSGANLTAITWDHAVNSQALLNKALESAVQFIEADIVLGSLFDDETHALQPVMGHPPLTESDISLASFLQQVLEHNSRPNATVKGVKLDFKSIEVFRGSAELLQTLWPRMTYPVWINADILPGPLNNTETRPVDPVAFFAGVRTLNAAVLSVGWTTKWSADHRTGEYTGEQVRQMIAALRDNNVTSSHAITFPVRAGIAAQSVDALQSLLAATNATNPATLTIWSSANDYVDIAALRRLILAVGVDRVYVDVPPEVADRLDLGSGASARFGSVGVALLAIGAWLAAL